MQSYLGVNGVLGGKESREEKEIDLMGANLGRLPGGVDTLNRRLKINGMCCCLEVVGEEGGSREIGVVCMWVWSLSALARTGQEGAASPEHSAAAFVPVCLGAAGLLAWATGLAGWPLGSPLPLSVLPSLPSLSALLFTK